MSVISEANVTNVITEDRQVRFTRGSAASTHAPNLR